MIKAGGTFISGGLCFFCKIFRIVALGKAVKEVSNAYYEEANNQGKKKRYSYETMKEGRKMEAKTEFFKNRKTSHTI